MEAIILQVLQAVTGGILPSAGNVQRNVMGSVVIGVLMATAYIAVIMTGWFSAYEAYGPVVASASVAAAALLVALLAWALIAFLNRRARERAARAALENRARSELSLTGLMADAALEAVPGMVKNAPVVTMLAISGLAYALFKSQGDSK